MLHDRLVSSGWRDELKEHCKEIIRRKGLEKVTVEELVAEITPKGRGKAELQYAFISVKITWHYIYFNFSKRS